MYAPDKSGNATLGSPVRGEARGGSYGNNRTGGNLTLEMTTPGC